MVHPLPSTLSSFATSCSNVCFGCSRSPKHVHRACSSSCAVRRRFIQILTRSAEACSGRRTANTSPVPPRVAVQAADRNAFREPSIFVHASKGNAGLLAGMTKLLGAAPAPAAEEAEEDAQEAATYPMCCLAGFLIRPKKPKYPVSLLFATPLLHHVSRGLPFSHALHPFGRLGCVRSCRCCGGACI